MEVLRHYRHELVSAITHSIGFLISAVGAIVLIVFAVRYATARHVVGFSIFGAALMLLYLASTAYHILPVDHSRKSFFQKIDRAAIYFLIAGTYTPICLIVLRNAWGWTLFGIEWAAAFVGIIYAIVSPRARNWIPPVIYLVMGWLVIIAIGPLTTLLPAPGVFWLFGGGLFYTIGTLFFSLERFVPAWQWFGMHELFHLFVIAGSFCHWWLMMEYVRGII